MKVAFGIKSHSGWAAVVALGRSKTGYEMVERRRIELIDDGELWAKQPYHAAENLEPVEAREVVTKGIDSARRVAHSRIKELLARKMTAGNDICSFGVIVPEPMPDWTVKEILAVHIRMHTAEGVLFPDALVCGCRATGLNTIEVHEKHLGQAVLQAFRSPLDEMFVRATELGRTVGPPWGKDQKLAAIAAMIALKLSN